MEESGAIQELDEDYEDSSDMEDEDELNSRIQKKSTDSLPNNSNIDPLTRSQTEPPGDLSSIQYQYKGMKEKHVTKKKKKIKTKTKPKTKTNNNNKKETLSTSSTSKNNKLSKSKSLYSSKSNKLSSKQSYKRDNIDVEDVESVEDEDFNDSDLMNQTITEDDVYLDMSITAEDYANNKNNDDRDDKSSKTKRSSTLDLVKNGLINAKKRLLSPEKMASHSHNNVLYKNGHNKNGKDSPISGSYNNHSPTTDNNNNNNHSLSSDDGNRKGSDSLSGSKKSSVSLFGGGGIKGLLRGNSIKDFAKQSDDDSNNDNDNNNNNNNHNEDDKKMGGHQHRKSPSKSSLSSIKAKLQNMKQSYSKNIVSKTPTPDQLQQKQSRKPPKKKKTSSKKKEREKKEREKKERDNKITNGDDTIKRKKGKIDGKTKQIRKRSSSQNKAIKQGTDSSIIAPPKRGMTIKPKQDTKPKRHSMQPVIRSNVIRSRSQKPKRTKEQKNVNNNNNNKKPNKSKKEISKTQISRKSASHVDPLKFRKTMSEHGVNKNNKNDDLKEQYDDFTGHGHRNKKMNKSTNDKLNKLGVDNNKTNNKMRRKSGGDNHIKMNKMNKNENKKKEKELDQSMIAADKKCKFRIKNEIFELYEYYKPIRLIGSGAYAVVCEAIDERTKKRVAIKKNKHIFDDIRDARRILREIKLLLHFNKYKHPDLIEIYDSLPPTVGEIQEFEDVYIVMPLLESNLCKIITSKQKLSNLHYQYLTYQVLRGLKFIHESGVIHRDIKPENILLNGSDCDVKIIDFGLARGVLGEGNEDNPENAKATEYVCTRWYRSPEVMCSGGRYDEKMDIWGVGCILAEMILRRPLFPGANYLDQLQQIFDIMGTPNDVDWILNDQARNWVLKLPKHNGKNLKKMIQHKFEDNKDDLENCTDLLYKLLALNPADRISAANCLSHPYFNDMHDEDEILEGDKFDLSFEFEQSIKTKFGVRHMMYAALDQYHKKQWHKIKKKQRRKAEKERLKKQQQQQQQPQQHRKQHHHHHRSKHKNKDK